MTSFCPWCTTSCGGWPRRKWSTRAGQTLQATALVHEAYLRLVDVEKSQRWNGRGHFFAAAAEAMRRILVENVRCKRGVKHGGGCQRVALVEPVAYTPEPADELLALSEALDRLAEEDPNKAELVKLATSPACRSRKPPMSWASPAPPRIATGPTPRSGCTAPSPERAIRKSADVFSSRRGAPAPVFALSGRQASDLGLPPWTRRASIAFSGTPCNWPCRTNAAAYLDRACGDDAGLRRKVEQLLQARSKAENFLEAPAVQLVPSAAEIPVCEGPGTVIGPYKLLEQIGEGGFGLVFMAEQQQPVRRKVAVKVIKPGMDTRQVIARFEAERHSLALMDHPQHCPGARSWRNRHRPALLRHGAGPRSTDHRILRQEQSAAPATPGTFPARSARPCSTPTRKASFTAI